MKLSNDSVTEFIKSIQNETRQKDGFFVIDLMRRITNLEPERWGPSIIGFGNYIQEYETGRKSKLPLMAFSPRKQHLVLYVLNNFEKQQQLLDKLGKHRTGKICLYINKISDVNLGVLEEIIECSFNKFKLKK
ncbi:DUF1801 domain-containing protein [Ekhidna sp.]|uniref:DUF1801 domain-containing protein n=1 Tax=Ekhidna sp. TaxID=2608089 RepID=UPI003299B82C